MIAFIRGTVHHKTEHSVILDTGALGYEVFVPEDLLFRLDEGEELFLHLYQQTKEDGTFLFGFLRPEDLALFRRLVGVSGVGPRMGMAMFSVKSRREIILGIVNERVDVLSEVSGIGPKTAKRMILELKDVLTETAEALETGGLTEATGEFPGVCPPESPYMEALEGLLSLGYTRREVDVVLQNLLAEDEQADAGVLITRALRNIGRQRSQ